MLPGKNVEEQQKAKYFMDVVSEARVIQPQLGNAQKQ